MNIKKISLALVLALASLGACTPDDEPKPTPTPTPMPKPKPTPTPKPKPTPTPTPKPKPTLKENKLKEILDYRPAIGQWVNELPKYADGDGQAEMNAKVLKDLQNNELITLGGFGGYVVMEFDRPITNEEGYDFKIFGNAFAGSSEAGIVSVANDDNGNGKPDKEEWYELKGSAYDLPTTIKSYSIDYKAWQTSNGIQNCVWFDNQGGEGIIEGNSYHTQPYYPLWIEQDGYTLSGTRLECKISTNASGWTVLETFEWGYVDNHPNSNQEGNSFDIANAVDSKGKSKELKEVKWVKVHTAINKVNGALGEVSTEIQSVKVLTK